LRICTEERGCSINFERWHPIGALVKAHADGYEYAIDDVEARQRADHPELVRRMRQIATTRV
jgi:hypothetical protein